MRIDIFKDELANRINENKVLKFTLIIISIAWIISAYFSYQAVKHQKTIVIPFGLDSRIVVNGDFVDNAYLHHWAKFSLNLLFNYTPSTFEHQSNHFLKICSPNFFSPMQNKLRKMKQSVSRLKITSSYFPKEFKVDRALREIYVEGLRLQHAQGREMESQSKKYLIKYRIINGRFFVDDTREIK